MRLRLSMISTILAIAVLVAIGTWLFYALENWSWAESFYFAVTTLTTVGYGDIHPTSDTSRIVAAIYILIGVGIMFAALTSIGSRYLATQEHKLSDNITRRVKNRRSSSQKRRR